MLYAAALGPGAVALVSSRYDNTHQFYHSTVTIGEINLQSQRLESGQGFYQHSLLAGHVLYPGLLESINSFYASTVSTGDVLLYPTRYDNAHVFFTAAIFDPERASGKKIKIYAEQVESRPLATYVLNKHIVTDTPTAVRSQYMSNILTITKKPSRSAQNHT